ncbi:glycosyltransferase [Roseateles sp.]|uniref:glycosyltransferase n=1 Tax=Roseateles sp. TaxID=1971397 RepID=UPI003BA8977A
MLDLICATRLTAHDFWTRSALGQSLRRLAYDHRLKPQIAFENRRGLPAVYNERIAAPDAEPLLMFIHDDVWLDDHFFVEHTTAALEAADVIGVAGNRRRVPGQPSWAFPTPRLEWDDSAHLSGTVGHAQHPFGTLAHFGPTPAPCELLDGVLLAARRDLLREKQLRFDERFDFHFYDMDFCRSARQAGLRLTTWPIAITHQSKGNAGSADWRRNYDAYLAKWTD